MDPEIESMDRKYYRNGEIIFEMLIQSADTYCHHWLLESGNPVRGRSFGLEAIACEGDHVPWRQYLTRAYSRIYPSLSQDLITEHLEDVAECSLNAFQKLNFSQPWCRATIA